MLISPSVLLVMATMSTSAHVVPSPKPINHNQNPPLGVEVISEFQEFQEFKTTQSNFKR